MTTVRKGRLKMWSYWWKCLSTFCSRSWGAADSSCDLWRAVRVKTHCSLRREHLVAYQVPRIKKNVVATFEWFLIVYHFRYPRVVWTSCAYCWRRAAPVNGCLAAAMTNRSAYLSGGTISSTRPAMLHIGGWVGLKFLFLPWVMCCAHEVKQGAPSWPEG